MSVSLQCSGHPRHRHRDRHRHIMSQDYCFLLRLNASDNDDFRNVLRLLLGLYGNGGAIKGWYSGRQ